MNKETFSKIDSDNVKYTITKEVDEEVTLHIPDLELQLQKAKDEVVRLETLLDNAKKAK